MRYKKFFIINFTSSMLLGCLIYFFFRQDILLNTLESKIKVFLYLRNLLYIDTADTLFWIFLKYYMPDMLWTYSLTFCAYLGFKREITMVLFPLTASVFIEVGQELGFMYGTADVCDIAVEVLGIIFALAVIEIYNMCTTSQAAIKRI